MTLEDAARDLLDSFANRNGLSPSQRRRLDALETALGTPPDPYRLPPTPETPGEVEDLGLVYRARCSCGDVIVIPRAASDPVRLYLVDQHRRTTAHQRLLITLAGASI